LSSSRRVARIAAPVATMHIHGSFEGGFTATTEQIIGIDVQASLNKNAAVLIFI
jgi:hypothetical protein